MARRIAGTSRSRWPRQRAQAWLRCRCEPLEDRRLLSGVTLITHGFNSDVNSWVGEMADAIATRPDLTIEQPRYRVEVTDPGHDGGPLSVVNTARSGPSPASSGHSAEIVILLNWTDVAGTIAIGGGYHRSTRDIAAAVAEQLVAPNFLSDFAQPLAQLPFHLIGHSRGASLVGELAKKLGEYGVWVDQVTTLDPHPVDGVREPTFFNLDFNDAPMTSWENVTFWDNYWRSEGSGSLDFTGEAVANAYSLQLSESVLSSGGYSNEHSDVHLWYHGTIDTSASANDGDFPVPAAWYGGAHPARGATGFYYSRLVGGTRNAAGLAASLGGAAVRTSISWSGASWPNVLELEVDSVGGEFAVGAPIPTSYYYQDFDSGATISLLLDPDRNPYNGNGLPRDQYGVNQTSAVPVASGAALSTGGVSPGTYYVAAQISDAAGHVRYAFAPAPITLVAPPSLDVINTLDSGPGSLRQAILNANATPGVPDVIAFAIPGGGPQAIQLAAALPDLIDAATLDLPAGQDVRIGTASAFTLPDFVSLTKVGAGALTIGGNQAHAGGATLVVDAGALTLLGDGGAKLSLAANHVGTLLNLAATQHLASLSLADGAVATLIAGGGKRLVVDALDARGGATLDLADNDLIVRATPSTRQAALAALTAAVASGSAGLAWNGPGIHSSVAAADASHRTALGTMLNDDGLGGAYYTSFAGEPVDPNSILVKYTYYGDADLSGAIDGTDYALTDNGFNAGSTGWFNGDFDYSAAVDGTDYALIDNAFNGQTGPLSQAPAPLPRAALPPSLQPADVLSSLECSGAAANLWDELALGVWDHVDLAEPNAWSGRRRR